MEIYPNICHKCGGLLKRVKSSRKFTRNKKWKILICDNCKATVYI